MVDGGFEMEVYRSKINALDKFATGVMRNEKYYLLVEEWLNSLLFNIAALNEEYKEDLSQSSNISSEESVWISEKLSNVWTQTMPCLLSMKSLHIYIKEAGTRIPISLSEHKHRHGIEYTLLSTVKYLCSKINLHFEHRELIEKTLEQLSSCECQCTESHMDSQVIEATNELIFGTEKEQKFSIDRLKLKLESNFNANLISLAVLIDSNYYNYETARPIFFDCKLNGAQLMLLIAEKMVDSCQANELFSEDMLNKDRLFQLFMTLIEYRHLSLYVEWLEVISSNKKQSFVKEILDFLYALPIEHPEFANIIRHIFNELVKKKKSKNVAVDILKKLILNRFLLDPFLFKTYSMNEIESNELAVHLNNIRLLFYSKKIQNQASITDAQRIEGVFASFVSSPITHIPQSLENKSVIYHLDKSLNRDYEIVETDLLGRDPYGGESNRKSNPNFSYELSFSFIKNNVSKDDLTYRSDQKQIKSHTSIIDNHSINTMIDQIKSKPNIQSPILKSPNVQSLTSPVSEKSRKTVHTEHSEIPIMDTQDKEMVWIEELLAERRILGISRKACEERKARKNKERKMFYCYLDKVHDDFNEKKREIESEANRIRLIIDLA